MAALAAGLRKLDLQLLAEPQVNILFARVDQSAIERLTAEQILFYEIGDGVLRFVTSFQTTDDDVEEALRRIERALNPS